jgi:hypothetical protein
MSEVYEIVLTRDELLMLAKLLDRAVEVPGDPAIRVKLKRAIRRELDRLLKEVK